MHLQTTTENMILTLKFTFGKVKQIVVKRRHNLAEFSALSRIFTKTFCLVLFNYNNVKKKKKTGNKKKKKKSSSDLYQILEVFNKCCLTRND